MEKLWEHCYPSTCCDGASTVLGPMRRQFEAILSSSPKVSCGNFGCGDLGKSAASAWVAFCWNISQKTRGDTQEFEEVSNLPEAKTSLEFAVELAAAAIAVANVAAVAVAFDLEHLVESSAAATAPENPVPNADRCPTALSGLRSASSRSQKSKGKLYQESALLCWKGKQPRNIRSLWVLIAVTLVATVAASFFQQFHIYPSHPSIY